VKSIIFICTGNIFRSMSAEYALKALLAAETGYRVGSAGIHAEPQAMAPFVLARLQTLGLDPSQHRQRKVEAALLAETDLVVSMGFDHRDHLRHHFNYESWLFNQICFGKEEPVLDIWEVVPNWQTDKAALQAYAVSVVDYIHQAMPLFVKNMGNYLK
jgi:protein-tyrosine phosphatase